MHIIHAYRLSLLVILVIIVLIRLSMILLRRVLSSMDIVSLSVGEAHSCVDYVPDVTGENAGSPSVQVNAVPLETPAVNVVVRENTYLGVLVSQFEGSI